ncbi:MAG: hypothetical protein BWY83_00075 [bacterium ADurb.Bin478]|nr:MAG: hypothetical protein BWY83_00075 [bacterium ADurb.Bin478]
MLRLLIVCFVFIIILFDFVFRRSGYGGGKLIRGKEHILCFGFQVALHIFLPGVIFGHHRRGADEVVQFAHGQGGAQVVFHRGPELAGAGIVQRGLIALHVEGAGAVLEHLVLAQLLRRIVVDLFEDLIVGSVEMDLFDHIAEQALLHQRFEHLVLDLLQLIAFRIAA